MKLLSFAFSLICTLIASPARAENNYAEDIIALAARQSLASESQWKALLYVRPNAFGPNTSLIADPAYFIANDGKTNSQHELEETIRALLSEPANDQTYNQHAQCRYPARFYWLKQRLHLDPAKMPKVKCQYLDNFLRAHSPQAVSIVFSSYYTHNPGSMFGHTFFRFHRKPGTEDHASSLLDDSVSFAADIGRNDNGSDLNPWTYVYRGLTGGFQGRFSFLPFYAKVQEYNNFESRDLWDYRLDLTSEEIYLMWLSLIEVSPYYIDYYFTSDNCALIPLFVLRAARPSIDLTSDVGVIVTPADTLRLLDGKAGLIKETAFTPSSWHRVLHYLNRLSDSEVYLLKNILPDRSITKNKITLEKSSDDSVARILDAALEFLDYEKLQAGENAASIENDIPWQNELLVYRSHAKQIKEMPEDTLPNERPNKSHPPSMVSFGFAYSKLMGTFGRIGWRPLLHDLSSPSAGYPQNLEITALDTNFRVKPAQRNVSFESLNLLKIFSLAPWNAISHPFSWHFSSGIENVLEEQQNYNRFFLEAGAGSTFGTNDKQSMLYIIPIAIITASTSRNQIGAGVLGGFRNEISPRLNCLTSFRNQLTSDRGTWTKEWSVKQDISLMLSDKLEERITLELRKNYRSAQISTRYYF